MKLKHYLRTIMALVGLLILSFSLLAASTNEVAIDGTKPFTSIQKAILASKNGDIVLVYPGVYKENIDFKGKNITVSSLFPISKDWSSITNTIIDGDANGLSVVTFESGETPAAKLVGFTVRNGNTTVGYHGGGITIRLAAATISYCRIIGNHATSGGGIQINSAGAGSIVESCTFEQNTASQGGAIYVFASDASVRGSLFDRNAAVDGGSGVYWYGRGSIDIRNSLFEGNRGQFVIAGPGAEAGGQAVLVNCSLFQNTSTQASIYSLGTLFIVNSIVQDITATQIQIDGVAFLDNNTIRGGVSSIKATSTTSIKYGVGNTSNAILFDSSIGLDGVPAKGSAAIGGGVSHIEYPGRTIDAGGRDVYDTIIVTNGSVAINIGAVQFPVAPRKTDPRPVTATATIVNGFVVGANITDMGYGYEGVIPPVTFLGGGGSGAKGTAIVSNGMVTGISITATGGGYTKAPYVLIAAPPGLARVEISVHSVDVTLHLIPGYTYKIQTATDSGSTWVDVETGILAVEATLVRTFDVTSNTQLFRVVQVN